MSWMAAGPPISSFIFSCGVMGMRPCLPAAKLGWMSTIAVTEKGEAIKGEEREGQGNSPAYDRGGEPDWERLVGCGPRTPRLGMGQMRPWVSWRWESENTLLYTILRGLRRSGEGTVAGERR